MALIMRNKAIIATIIISVAAITIFFANTRITKVPVVLMVSIVSAKESFEFNEDVVVEVIIQNPSDRTIQLLKWHTPLEDIERPLFIVTINGNPVPYVGKLVKRAAPVKQDYIEFKPGDQVRMNVTLSDVYDLSAPGEYRVIYETASFQLYDIEINDRTEEDRLRSEEIIIRIK